MLLQPVIFFVFLSIAGGYFVIIILIQAGLIRNKAFGALPKTFHTKATVIIPARNEENNILNVLNDLLQQDFPSDLLEIILVDDGSTDQTLMRINDFISKNPSFPVSVIKNDPSETRQGSKKRAINTAVTRSSGELILATDADTRFGKKWIAAMVSYYEKFHPEMILGPVAYHDNGSLFSKIQSCEFMGLMAVTEGSCSMKRPLMCNGANIAYSRKAFDMVGGFDDNFKIPSGDDMFLMMKIRRKAGKNSVQFNRSKEAIVLTEPNRTLREFIHQRLRWVSKSKGYKDPAVWLVAVFTYLINLSLLTGIILCIFFSSFQLITLLIFAGKIIVEFPVIWRSATLFGKQKIMILVPVVQVLNIFYVSIIGLMGNFISYDWKGRIVNPSGKS